MEEVLGEGNHHSKGTEVKITHYSWLKFLGVLCIDQYRSSVRRKDL